MRLNYSKTVAVNVDDLRPVAASLGTSTYTDILIESAVPIARKSVAEQIVFPFVAPANETGVKIVSCKEVQLPESLFANIQLNIGDEPPK